MLDKLHALEQTVLSLKKQHTVTATELANLKLKVANDNSAATIKNLQQTLATTQAELEQYKTQTNKSHQENRALQAQLEDLTEESLTLKKQNQELIEKNRLAIERAEIIQDWLAKIDAQN